MSGRSDRVPVDLDRLADHAAGLLDGTPQAAEVERLLATDPAWASAAAELRAADARVRAELAALDSPPVPPEVAARIEWALAGERPESATPDPTAPPTSPRTTSPRTTSPRTTSPRPVSPLIWRTRRT